MFASQKFRLFTVSSVLAVFGAAPLGAAETKSPANPAAADVPAAFWVTDQVINPNPGGFTATTGPKHLLADFSFEPLVWRVNRYLATKDASGKIFSDQFSFYDTFAPGYLDGAEVRVLRIENGKMVQKLGGAKVKKHIGGQWSSFGSSLLAPDRNKVEFTFEDWSKPGQQWWLSVVAVDKDGRESARSNAVSFTDPVVRGDGRAKPENSFNSSSPRLNEEAEGSAPAAPQNFQVQIDPETSLITAEWSPVTGEIAGYRIDRTYIDPANHQEEHLELDATAGGDSFAIKKGDLVLITRKSNTHSIDWFSPRVTNASVTSPPDYAPNFTPVGEWQSTRLPFELVPHPGKIPEGINGAGETCIKITSDEAGKVALRKYNYADATQNWYRVLQPDETYVVEFIARQEGISDGNLRFEVTGPHQKDVEPVDFPVTGEWQRFTTEFTVPHVLDQSASVGMMGLVFEGPGTLWLDNFRIYEKSEGLARHSAADQAAIKESGMSAIRTHDTVKTQGYTLENLLGHPEAGLSSGNDIYSRGNLSALLKEFKEMGVIPWLQIEFTLSEDEWKNLVEYLAAPYDPAKDTPQSKPWAYRRVQHGQKEPYTDVFPKILFEFSNENWNQIMPFNLAGLDMPDAVTGKVYVSGEIYGMFQEYTIQLMKSSPYWTPEMEKKAEFVIGGWGVNNFGYDAVKFSPSSKHVLVADYNGGWDAGEGPETVGDLDAALRKTLIFGAQHSLPNALRLREVRDKFAKETGIKPELGTYEAGPGYNINGLNGVRMTPEMVEFESLAMKSLAAGASTLDCFMNQATQGAKLQNFFTFSRNRNYWTSHTEMRAGGHAYPSWMALSLYNRYAVGDILNVLTISTPTIDAPAVGQRKAMPDAPLTTAYATRNGDRLAVIAISRKLDGFTPTTLQLPITGAKKVTLHTLTGDPRSNNLDAQTIKPASIELPASVVAKEFVLDKERGAPQGLPPASVFLYVFEGCQFADSTPTAAVAPAPGVFSPTDKLPIPFRVLLSAPPQTFTTENVKLSGAAEPFEPTITEVPGTYAQAFDVIVNKAMGEGTVEVKTTGLTTAAGKPIADASGSIEFQIPPGTLLPIVAWNFTAAQTEADRDWKGTPIPATEQMPVIEPVELAATDPDMLGDNGYYNNDGAGTWVPGNKMQDGTHFYSFTVTPKGARKFDIDQVECGFWSSADLNARLEVWVDGSLVGEAPFVADKSFNNKGILEHNAGIRASADTSKIAALQGLAKPAEFRIIFFGLETEGGIFGIGKLGKENKDLTVLGRITK